MKEKNMGEKDELLILAVVGMPATGKSEVIKSLKDDFNFFHLYYGDITFDELKRRNLEVNEVNERFVREDLRKDGDMGIYSKLLLPKIEKAIEEGHKNILLESMYNIYEYEVIQERFGKSFKVLAIHSDENIRIQRLNTRKERKLTREELHSRQIAEAKNLGKGTVISLADYHLVNNGNNMETFKNELVTLLKGKLDLKAVL